MKKLFISVIALLVLLIGAAFIVPGFIDGNAYKSRIISLAESATGRSLAISGDVSLRLLPSPALSAKGVRLANVADAATAEMLSLESIQVQVALLPLLRGKVEVRSVRLVEPVIELEILADGTANWAFPSDDDAAGQPSGAARGAAGGRARVAADDDRGGGRIVSLARFEIVRGKLTFRDESSGLTEIIEDLSAVFSAETLADGPYSGAGQMRVRGIPIRFDIAVGDRSRAGSIPISAELEASGIGASFAFRGTTRALAADAKVFGRLEVAGEDLRAALQPLVESGLFTTSLPVPGAQAFSLKAMVEGTREDLAFNEVDLKLGEARATGAVSAVLSGPIAVDATLAVGLVDLDTWLAAVPIPGPAAGNGGAARPRRAAPRTAGEPDAVASDDGETFVAIPDDVSGSVSLRIDALTYRGNAVRQVEFSVNLANGIATISRASAQLPGGSDFTLVGSATNVDGQARFDGTLEVVSDDLRAVLSWLGIEVPSVPPGRLRKLSLQSTVRVTPELGQIFGIDLRLDSSRLTGGAAYAFRDRPSFSVDFAIDRLNADAYRMPGDAGVGAGAGADDEGAPTVTPNASRNVQADTPADEPNGSANRGLAILNDFDANIKVSIGVVTYNDTRLDGLLVDGTVLGGRLTLREASVADIAGARVSLTGAAGDFGRIPVFASTLEVTAQDPGGLFRLFGVSLPVSSDRLGPTELKGTLSGSQESIEIDLTTRLRNTRAKIDGTVALGAANENVDLSIGIVNDSFVDFASVLGFDVKPTDPGLDGRISVSGSLGGTFDNLALDVRAAVQDATFTLAGSLADLSNTPRFNFLLGAEHPEVVTFLKALGIPYRPSATNLGGFRLAADIAGDSTRVQLTSIEGRAGPVTFAGAALADLDRARPRIEADLEMSEVLIDLFLPRVSPPGSGPARPAGAAGNAAPASAQVPTRAPRRAGNRRWSTDPLDLAVLRSFDADIKISARGLIYGSFSFEEPRISLTLDDGTLDIQPLTGKLFGGDITLNMRVEEGPVLNLIAGVSLTGADIERALGEAAAIDRVTGRFDMTGEFVTSGQSQLDMVSNLRGRADFSAADGQLRGVDLAALSQRLENLGQGLDVLSLVLTSLSGGATRYRSFQGSFDIENGVARTTDLSADLDAAQGSGEGIIDIANWQIDLRTTARLTEHPRAPPVGLDLRGPLDAPRRDLRTKELEAYLLEQVGTALLKRILPRETRGTTREDRLRPRNEPLDTREILRGILRGIGD